MWPWVSYLNSWASVSCSSKMRIAGRPLLTRCGGVIRSGRGAALSPACGKQSDRVLPISDVCRLEPGRGLPLAQEQRARYFTSESELVTSDDMRVRMGSPGAQGRCFEPSPPHPVMTLTTRFPQAPTWAGLACSEMLRTKYLRPGSAPSAPTCSRRCASVGRSDGLMNRAWASPSQKGKHNSRPLTNMLFLTDLENTEILTGRQPHSTQGRLSMMYPRYLLSLQCEQPWNP